MKFISVDLKITQRGRIFFVSSWFGKPGSQRRLSALLFRHHPPSLRHSLLTSHGLMMWVLPSLLPTTCLLPAAVRVTRDGQRRQDSFFQGGGNFGEGAFDLLVFSTSTSTMMMLCLISKILHTVLHRPYFCPLSVNTAMKATC